MSKKIISVLWNKIFVIQLLKKKNFISSIFRKFSIRNEDMDVKYFVSPKISGNLRKPSKSSEREREGGVVKDKKEVVKNRLPVIRRFKIQLHPNFG